MGGVGPAPKRLFRPRLVSPAKPRRPGVSASSYSHFRQSYRRCFHPAYTPLASANYRGVLTRCRRTRWGGDGRIALGSGKWMGDDVCSPAAPQNPLRRVPGVSHTPKTSEAPGALRPWPPIGRGKVEPGGSFPSGSSARGYPGGFLSIAARAQICDLPPTSHGV
jgi:hypothetical protein